MIIISYSPILLHAGTPNVMRLTFDRESRTFNCTSTGGPATTVTWTKDGAVITPSTTHQQTQMIVDSVEGIYQNTLTIAQSVTGDNLYGLYSCMVENSWGTSNRKRYVYGKITSQAILGPKLECIYLWKSLDPMVGVGNWRNLALGRQIVSSWS